MRNGGSFKLRRYQKNFNHYKLKRNKKKTNNEVEAPKNPFLQVYLLRPSKWQELAGPCKTLV